MEELKGTLIPINSLPKLIKIKDLIFFNGPLLSHFESSYKENFLFYWVDADDIFNRWLIFRTTEELIDDYIEKRKSLFELITNPDNGNLYKVDIDNDSVYNNLALVALNDLPNSYLPEKHSYYTFQVKNSNEELQEISKKESVGILQAYFNESSKIGKGTIDLEVLAPSLSDFNNINKGIRKAFINREKANYNRLRPKNIRKEDRFDELAIVQASSFLYFGNTSRSFGALFKSSSQQSSLPNLISIEDRYIEYFIDFFQNSTNIESFIEFIKDVDKSVIDSYKKLLLVINKSKIQFNLNYQNSVSNFSTSKKISYTQAGEILRIIDNMVYDNSNDVYLTGRFTALHLKTGHYQFETVSQDQKIVEVSNGYLDIDRKEVAWKIKWDKLYDVVITRKNEKKTGQKKPKTIDIIVSFVELDKTISLSE